MCLRARSLGLAVTWGGRILGPGLLSVASDAAVAPGGGLQTSGLANLATGLWNWTDSKSGKRKGPKVRFPRFKGKRAGLSCRFTTGAFGLACRGRRHVRLPRIGVIRTHEPTWKLARRVERGSARIRSATVSYRRGRWPPPPPALARGGPRAPRLKRPTPGRGLRAPSAPLPPGAPEVNAVPRGNGS